MKNTITSIIKDEWFYTSRFLYRFRWFRKSTKCEWTKVKWWTGRVYWVPIRKSWFNNNPKYQILDSEDYNENP